MPKTQITNNSLATGVALSNLNAGANITFTKQVIVPSFGASAAFGTGVITALATTTNSGGGFVTANGTATLTNKTLTSPVINDIANSSTASSLTITTNAITDVGVLRLRNNNIGANSTLHFIDSTNNARQMTIGYGNTSSTSYASSCYILTQDRDLYLSTANATVNATNHVVVKATTGLVGIGTSSPSERLTVSGNISATGTIIASNYNPASNVATFLATPTSANLAAAVSDETGSGALVFANGPTFGNLTLNGTTYTYGTGAASAHRTALELDKYYNSRDINLQSSTIVYDFDNSLIPNLLGVSRTIPSGGLAQIANAGGTHWTSKVKGWIRINNPTTNDTVTEVQFLDAIMPYQSGTGTPTAHNNYTLVYVFACPVLTNVDIRLGLRTGNVARLVQIFQDNVVSPGSSPVFNYFTNNGTYTNTATATGAISGASAPLSGSYTTAVGTRYAFVFDTYQRAGGTDTTVVLKIYSGDITGDLTLAGTYNLTSWNPVNTGSTPYVSVRNLNSSAAGATTLQLDTMIFKSWNNTSNILPTEILDIFKTT
jgi:hypothetical protein